MQDVATITYEDIQTINEKLNETHNLTSVVYSMRKYEKKYFSVNEIRNSSTNELLYKFHRYSKDLNYSTFQKDNQTWFQCGERKCSQIFVNLDTKEVLDDIPNLKKLCSHKFETMPIWNKCYIVNNDTLVVSDTEKIFFYDFQNPKSGWNKLNNVFDVTHDLSNIIEIINGTDGYFTINIYDVNRCDHDGIIYDIKDITNSKTNDKVAFELFEKSRKNNFRLLIKSYTIKRENNDLVLASKYEEKPKITKKFQYETHFNELALAIKQLKIQNVVVNYDPASGTIKVQNYNDDDEFNTNKSYNDVTLTLAFDNAVVRAFFCTDRQIPTFSEKTYNVVLDQDHIVSAISKHFS